MKPIRDFIIFKELKGKENLSKSGIDLGDSTEDYKVGLGVVSSIGVLVDEIGVNDIIVYEKHASFKFELFGEVFFSINIKNVISYKKGENT